jgi:hypothetical protein
MVVRPHCRVLAETASGTPGTRYILQQVLGSLYALPAGSPAIASRAPCVVDVGPFALQALH